MRIATSNRIVRRPNLAVGLDGIPHRYKLRDKYQKLNEEASILNIVCSPNTNLRRTVWRMRWGESWMSFVMTDGAIYSSSWWWWPWRDYLGRLKFSETNRSHQVHGAKVHRLYGLNKSQNICQQTSFPLIAVQTMILIKKKKHIGARIPLRKLRINNSDEILSYIKILKSPKGPTEGWHY